MKQLAESVGVSGAISIPQYVEQSVRQDWLARVFAKRDSWRTYFEFINSLGSAWYLDIEVGMLHRYHASALHTNQLLAELPGFVETLAGAAKFMQAPDGSSGLPVRARRQNLGPYWADAGVVIMTRGGQGEIHADFEGLSPYPEKLFDKETRAYSAVLSLARPEVGGNLKIWLKHQLADENPALEDFQAEIIDYSPGSMAIFDSFCYHQILSSTLTEASPYRAIAAMHFLYLDNPYPHFEYWF